MSTSIGHTFMYNMIIFFILIFFAFISASMSYYKGYKVNSTIVKTIEKYEGYNYLAKEEIERNLHNLGYSSKKSSCEYRYKNMYLVSDNNYDYCVYVDKTNIAKGDKYLYGVLTYMQIDLPVVNIVKLPVFTKTNHLYKFTSTQAR